MRNKIRLCMALMAVVYCSNLTTHAQVTIGADKLPEEFSVLQLEGKYGDKAYGGLRLPQLTEGQKKELTAKLVGDKAIGLVIFNLSTSQLEYWNGSTWSSFLDKAFLKDPDCYGVYDVDGNFYYAGRFGEAGCWMTQNLRVTRYSDGTSLVQNDIADTPEAKYYTYPSKDQAVFDANPEYGLLYTWAAATNGVANDSIENASKRSVKSNHQGICPEGWVLPSDKDWLDLERELTQNASKYSKGVADETWNSSWELHVEWRGNHGRILKSKTQINGKDTRGGSKVANAGGFNALLIGRGDNFSGAHAFWWTSTARTGIITHAWLRHVENIRDGVWRNSYAKTYFHSVRCKKQEN